MKPGKDGEVILEHRLEGWYVKIGARLLGNKALVQHVKETPFEEDGTKVLSPEHTEGVKEGLARIGRMGHFVSAPLTVYPMFARMRLQELEQPPQA
jgi:hypothetical protein